MTVAGSGNAPCLSLSLHPVVRSLAEVIRTLGPKSYGRVVVAPPPRGDPIPLYRHAPEPAGSMQNVILSSLIVPDTGSVAKPVRLCFPTDKAPGA